MKTIIHLLLLSFSTISLAQQSITNAFTLELLRSQILENNPNINFQDLNELLISNQTTNQQSGVTNTYVKQYYNGIEIYNAISSIHVYPDGMVQTVNDRFEAYVAARVNSNTPGISSIEAIEYLASEENYLPTSMFKVIEALGTANKQQLISDGGISREAIPAKLVYFVSDNGQLRLAWNLIIKEKTSNAVWNYRLDVQTNQILDKFNMTKDCNQIASNGEK